MKLRYLLFIFTILSVWGCSEDKPVDRLDGDWDDDIKLSRHELIFDANTGTEVVTSEGTWWVADITNMLTGKHYHPTENNDINKVGSLGSYEWLRLEKTTTRSLQIAVEANDGAERKMRIALTTGDFFDYITVTQKGKE
ncbi:MAG: hypothetical protein ACLS37_10390 [Alistipes sp.]